MSRAGTIILLTLVVLVAGFLFVVEPRLTSTRENLATRDFVLDFDPANVDGVRIVSGDSAVEIRRKGDGWWLGPQPKDRAAPGKVRQILEAAQNLRVTDVIRAGELGRNLELGDLGLAEARYEIDLLGDGDPSIVFGREASREGRVYVRKTDGQDVYIVSDDLQRLAFVNPRELRDRRLTDLSPNDIERFSVKLGTGEIAVERTARGWQIVKPLAARADAGKVNAFLAPLLDTTILDFIADESDDLSAYGLAEPRAEVVLEIEDDNRPQALRVGNPAKSADGADVLVAQFTARDSVYHLPARTWDALQITPEALRDRRLLDLNLDTIDRLLVRNGGDEIDLKRTETEWLEGDRVVAESRVATLVDTLSASEVKTYLPLDSRTESEAGLKAPQGEIRFDAWVSENTPESVAGRHPVTKLTVGKVSDGFAWVRVDDDPEICVVPAAPVKALLDVTSTQ